MKEEYVTLSQFEILENQVGSIQDEIELNDGNILEIVNALKTISNILSQKHNTSELDTAIDGIIY